MLSHILSKFKKSTPKTSQPAAKTTAKPAVKPADSQALLALLNDASAARDFKLAALKNQSAENLNQVLRQTSDPDWQAQIKKQLINHQTSQNLAQLDADALLDIVLLHRQSALRMQALALLPEDLYELIARESHDKAVLRHVRSHLASARAAKEQAQQQAQHIDSLIAALANLGGRLHIDPLWYSKFKSAQADWQQLEPSAISQAQHAAYNAALEACAPDLKSHQQQQDSAKWQQKIQNCLAKMPQDSHDNQVMQHWQDECQNLIDQIHAQAPEVDASSLQKAHAQGQQRQAALAQYLNQQQQIDAAIAQINAAKTTEDFDIGSALETLKNLPLQNLSADLPSVASAKQLMGELSAQAREKTHAEQDLIQRATRRLAQLQSHISREQHTVAADILHKFEHSLVPKLIALKTDASAQLLSQLDDLKQEFAKLQNWQQQSLAPLRQDLLDKLQTLQNARMAMPDKSRAYSQLQRQWHKLGQFEDTLAQDFHAQSAAIKTELDAFFQQRDANVQKLLAHLQKMIDELGQFVADENWRHADIGSLQNIVKSARQSWQQRMPLHHPQTPVLTRQYFAKLDIINAELESRFQAIAASKAELLQQAQSIASALGDNTALDNATLQSGLDQLQNLQKQWRELGSSFHKRDKKLWLQFKACNDAAFALRGKLRQQQDADFAQLGDKLNQLISQLATHSAAELEPQFQELCQELSQAPAFLQKKWHSQWQNAVSAKQQQTAKAQQKREQTKAQDGALFYQHLCLCEQNALLNQEFKLDDALWQKLDKEQQSPLLNRVAWLENPQSVDGAEQSARQAQLGNIAIAMEVLLDVPSPEDARQARLDYQLECLNSGAGGRKSAAQIGYEWQELEQQWLAVGACEREALEARRAACQAAYHALNGF